VSGIAIVGAGPGMGLAITRTFRSRGFDVALISRNRAKLDDLVGTLQDDGVNAAAHFGGIDVLEYSPVGGFGSTTLTVPTETDPSHVQHEMEFQLYGAITATQAVLPAMRQAGAGTLLYTTGAGSIDPVPQVDNVNAAAALLNWVINLHKELDGTGIQAAHVGIDVAIGSSDAVVPRFSHSPWPPRRRRPSSPTPPAGTPFLVPRDRRWPRARESGSAP
jgi:short-subunit dehydrogenase